MFTTTFYSFKGGVGRTMALANVATSLAISGKRVLIVDFDLEAPGLSSLFPSEDRSRGILEYVESYQASNTAPDVREYCYAYELDNTGRSVTVMPASANVGTHADTLARIDWQDLYEHKNGYLMMEDLKKQWQERLQVDYVFIDSRTGHTDVEGICTRQLPDALVLMFFPNEQNLLGITEVSRRVKADDSSDSNVTQLFVASNVPDLDDEHEVLGNLLGRFSKSLEYAELDALVHHYPSLRLLEEPLFVRDRRNTKLAKEYEALARAVRRANPADETGVMDHLDFVLAEGPMAGFSDERRRSVLNKVYEYHWDNANILFKMAVWKDRLGETDEALDVLDAVVELDTDFIEARLRRARLKIQHQEDRATATDDVFLVFHSPSSNVTELMRGVQLCEHHNLTVLPSLPESPALEKLDLYEICQLLVQLCVSTQALKVGRAIAESAYASTRFADDPGLDDLRNKLSCILIGLGQFESAMQVISTSGAPVDDEYVEYQLFNFAMAKWGATGKAPGDLFAQIVEGADPPGTYRTVNYDQCLAVACWAIGNSDDGLDYIESALRRSHTVFRPDLSCWSYRYLHGSKMRRELDAVHQLLQGRDILPAFMQQPDLFDADQPHRLEANQ